MLPPVGAIPPQGEKMDKKIILAISKFLHQHDPYGLKETGAPEDEYYAEASALCLVLKSLGVAPVNTHEVALALNLVLFTYYCTGRDIRGKRVLIYNRQFNYMPDSPVVWDISSLLNAQGH